MAKGTNFKLGTHAPRKSPHMALKKILEKGAWSGSRDRSRDPILGGDMRFNEHLLERYWTDRQRVRLNVYLVLL